jgi:glycosyltransferase involved in cell wall biosynthesis
MKIAYFVNRHPAISQTFIRREIGALEELGLTVTRYALRRPVEQMIDPDDIEELNKTSYILDAGTLQLVWGGLTSLVLRPAKVLTVFRLALKIGRNSDRGLLKNLGYAVEAIALAKFCVQDKIEHVHAHFGTNSAAIAMMAAEISGIPFSFTVHGPEEFEKNVTISLEEKLARAAFVVCISSFGKSQMMRWSAEEHWHKIFVVHCGIPAAELTSRAQAVPAERRLVCVGRLDREKAQLILVRAAARVREQVPDFKIVLVGDGAMRSRLERTIRELKLDEHFLLIGWASGERVREEIIAARALVLPSFAEGLPVVLMEALGLGRPVISTYVAGIPELVKPGTNGWLIPAGDDSALAQAVCEALLLPAQRLTEMGAAGMDAVAARHNVRTEAEKLRGLFQESVLERVRRP